MGRNKYGNRWTTVEWQGRFYRFQSAKEAKRAAELMLLQKGGHISDLTFQPKVPLIAGISYVPDFFYVEKDGRYVYEDSKGMKTAVFRIKEKLFRHLYPDIALIIS